MKKVFLLAVLLTAFVWTSNAQAIKFGAKAGANFASYGGDNVEDTELRTSFHVGAVAEFTISDKFSFQPELLYSSQGGKENYSEDGIPIERQLKLDYLNLPLMAKFYVTEGFSVQAGPQIGLLLAANEELEFAGESVEIDRKDGINDLDLGVNLGLGYKLPSGLFFDARYNLGLSNINDGFFGSVDDINVRGNVIQVSVGYSF